MIDACLERIAALDPVLNAVRVLAPAHAPVPGPLHGVPVLVKDNIDVAGLPTSAGSLALHEAVAARDAVVVERLRAAGAIILGKTNLTEFANFMTAGMPCGYSSLGGQVRHARDPFASPGGSSSGSATAVAAGFAPLALGTETSGSIVSPAAALGIVGLRPTHGLVPRGGILPLAASQDTAGPLARTVAEAAALFAVIADAPTDGTVSGRLGVIGTEREARALGAVPFAVTLPPAKPPLDVFAYEFKRDLPAYLEDKPVRSLAEIIAFNRRHPRALRFGQSRLLAAEATDLHDRARYEAARDAGRAAARAALDKALTGVDALLTRPGTLTALGARAGYPELVVGGLSLTGPPYSEARLFAYGVRLEERE